MAPFLLCPLESIYTWPKLFWLCGLFRRGFVRSVPVGPRSHLISFYDEGIRTHFGQEGPILFFAGTKNFFPKKTEKAIFKLSTYFVTFELKLMRHWMTWLNSAWFICGRVIIFQILLIFHNTTTSRSRSDQSNFYHSYPEFNARQ